MQTKLKVRAKIYSIMDGQTAIKAYANVDVGGLLCINSYTVSNSIKEPDSLFAFPPSYRRKNGGYKPYIEFPYNKDNPLADAIVRACKFAYRRFEETGKLHEYGEEVEVDYDDFLQWAKTPDDLGGKDDDVIDLSDVPF